MARRSSHVIMRIGNQTLWLFADSMATCISSGLTPKKSLELSGARSRNKALRKVVRVAMDRCDQGMSVSEALEPGVRNFPRYFLPVVGAGETSGRLVEAFQLLYHYCYRIGPSVRLVRNTWLYPLIIIVFGWIIRTGVFVYFGKYQAA
jgi:type II secretory pathway component PulF